MKVRRSEAGSASFSSPQRWSEYTHTDFVCGSCGGTGSASGSGEDVVGALLFGPDGEIVWVDGARTIGFGDD